jgi:hypothetical protein
VPGAPTESVPRQLVVPGSFAVVLQPQQMSVYVVVSAATPNLVDAPTSVLVAPGFSVPLGSVGPATTCPTTRLQNNIKNPKVYTNGTMRYACLTTSGEAKNTKEALSHDKWREAKHEEYHALVKNNTWHLVPSTGAHNIIDCKWVFKIKRKQDGSVERYKARLDAKGFN